VEIVSEAPVTAFQIELQMFHRLGAVLIFLAVLACACRPAVNWAPAMCWSGYDAWLALIFVQIGLGIETLHSNKAADIATLHVMIGALSLVTGALGCVIAFRRADMATKFADARTTSGGLNPPVALAVNK